MATREQSVLRFKQSIENLQNSKYIMANSKVFDVISSVNQSKLLSDMFSYLTKDYDFYNSLVAVLCEEDGKKSFKMPIKSTEVMAFTYCLLNEINYKRLQLTDLLDYFDKEKNYELAYQKFCQEVLEVFKVYAVQSATQLINITSSTSGEVIKRSTSERVEVESATKEDVIPSDIKSANLPVTMLRLLELDTLAVRSSRISKDEKEDLIYVLKTFSEVVRGKDSEKIKLCYLAYYHAFRPYKKIKNNLAGITELLKGENIV